MSYFYVTCKKDYPTFIILAGRGSPRYNTEPGAPHCSLGPWDGFQKQLDYQFFTILCWFALVTCQGEGTGAPGWRWCLTGRERLGRPSEPAGLNLLQPDPASKSYKLFVHTLFTASR